MRGLRLCAKEIGDEFKKTLQTCSNEGVISVPEQTWTIKKGFKLIPASCKWTRNVGQELGWTKQCTYMYGRRDNLEFHNIPVKENENTDEI